MATVTTTRTKTMLLEEIEAKKEEIELLKKDIEKLKRFKQYEEAAGELAALRDSFINAGFTKTEANELLKVTLANGIKSNSLK